jgi:hypothetical protein
MNRSELLKTLPKNLVWAELGVFLGDFSKEIYSITNPKKLYLVDIFPDNMISGDKDGDNIRELDIRNVPNELTEHFKDENVIIVKSTTKDFLEQKLRDNEKIDAVYIDADHSYEAVKSDLYLSYEVVKNGGFICGHDYSAEHFFGVFRAVNEFCLDKNLKIDILSSDKLPSFIIKKQSLFMYNIFCCHHKPLVERKNSIINDFSRFSLNVNFEESFQFGVDLFKNESILTDPEFSLIKKHFKIIDTILSQNIDYAFIIEDDLHIEDDFNLSSFFESIYNEREKFDIIFFGSCCGLEITNPEKGVLVYEDNRTRCAHGYFVNRKSCEVIKSSISFDKPYDHFLNKVIAESGIKCGWTYPHILQKSELGIFKSTLR